MPHMVREYVSPVCAEMEGSLLYDDNLQDLQSTVQRRPPCSQTAIFTVEMSAAAVVLHQVMLHKPDVQPVVGLQALMNTVHIAIF